MKENWKYIKDSKKYKISNTGKVINVDTDAEITQTKMKDGRKTIKTNENGKRNSFAIHILVAKHFIRDFQNDYVFHIDGNKDNNHVSNLEIVSRKDAKTKVELKKNPVTESLPGEIWKDINGYDIYKISNQGRVVNKVTNRLLNQTKKTVTSSTYYVVVLVNENNKCKNTTAQVHRLIADHFIENPNDYDYILHIDGDRCNNILTNLQWIGKDQHKKEIVKKNMTKLKSISNITQKDPIDDQKLGKDYEDKCVNTTEKWVYIEDADKYKISNTGKVICVDTNLEIIQTKGKDGRSTIGYINKFGCRKKSDVHILVAMHFIRKLQNDYVFHIDGDKTNNNASNLEIISRKNAKSKVDLKKNPIIQSSLDEIWKDIDGYDIYKISNLGRVVNKATNRVLKQCKRTVNDNSFYIVVLSNEYKRISAMMHRLLGDHFIANPNNYNCVMHIDHDRCNNNLSNLKWVSASQLRIKTAKRKIKLFDISTIESIPNEKWLTIPNYEKYMASTEGRILNKESGLILNPILNGGYYSVILQNLSIGKKNKRLRINRIIALTFIKNPDIENKNIIDHINNIKTDNRSVNLRWCTTKENANYYTQNHRSEKATNNGMNILQCDTKNNIIKRWNNVRDVIKHNPEYNESTFRKRIYNNKIYFSHIWKYDTSKNESRLIPGEIFKTVGIIKGSDYSAYEISNCGNIRNISTQYIFIKNIAMTGYYTISLRDADKNVRAFQVHRLVAQIHVKGHTNKKNIVNHIDENKLNNHAKNLEWTNAKGNITHSLGIKVDQINIKTKKIIKTHDSMADAMRSIKKTSSTGIRNCCKDGQKSHGGFGWQFSKKAKTIARKAIARKAK
jgi:hypothetical protein